MKSFTYNKTSFLLFTRSQNHTSALVCSLIEHHLNRGKISSGKKRCFYCFEERALAGICREDQMSLGADVVESSF